MPSSLWDSSNVRLTATPLDAYHLSQKANVHLAAVAGYIRHRNVASHNLSQFVGQAKMGPVLVFSKKGVRVSQSERRRREVKAERG